MKTVLLQPGYCCPIIQYAAIAQADTVVFEVYDNYQKQSYRTRVNIATATGVLTLTVPILHSRNPEGHQRTTDVQIENQFLWQRNHWRSLKTAYQTSPYFEYYEDEFEPLFTKTWESLSEFNAACHQVIMDCLQLDIAIGESAEYFRNPTSMLDLRHLSNPKKQPDFGLPQYNQLFGENHGYLPNLSILDLLFNEGPNAITYLEQVDLSILEA